MRYETVIGLEVHIELLTETKIFCSCPTEFGGEPNTHVCPVCLGLPGTLPTLNKKAVELSVRAGLAAGCEITPISRFDRKNKGEPMPQEQRPTEKFRTSVGGQALMEGIMMRGPEKICCAVRRPDGTIDLSYSDVTTHWYNKVPLVRGVCNMVENLMNGYKYLMHSADIAMTEEEKEEEKQNESKLDRWLDEHAGPKVQSALMTLSACAGVVLAIFLFTFLPTFLTGLVAKMIPMGRWPRVILEAVLKLAIFLGYMFLCTRMKEIHRMFQYHGAEHKTIACYEAGEELTVANIRRHTRFHPRCGTNYLFLVMAVSIVFFAAVGWNESFWLRLLSRIVFLPLVAGISYEVLKLAAKYENIFTKIIRAPGMALQYITTKEPTADMLEVAIASFNLAMSEPKEAMEMVRRNREETADKAETAEALAGQA